MLTTAEARAEITPLVRNNFATPEDSLRFTAACFGGADKEWSLAPLQGPGDPAKNPVLTQKIRNAMRHLGADRIYAPSPVKFNGKIIRPAELTKVMVLGHGILLFRNGELPADGTFLRTGGDAGAFSAAGCGVIVATLGGHLLFAHAGRDCVINRKRVLGEPDDRPFESVVDAIVDAFLALGHTQDDLSQLYAWPLYSIKPDDFLHRYDDEKHREYNRKVGSHLAKLKTGAGARLFEGGIQLDLPAIIKLQFVQRGVPWDNVSLTHSYLSDELPTTRNGGGRYLVAIVRH